MDKRKAEDILADLAKEVIEYNSLRDEEWEYEGNMEDWDAEITEAHEKLIGKILSKRRELERLLREATGNEELEF